VNGHAAGAEQYAPEDFRARVLQFDIRAKVLAQLVNREMHAVISATDQHETQPEQISLSQTRGKLSGETVVQQVDWGLHRTIERKGGKP